MRYGKEVRAVGDRKKAMERAKRSVLALLDVLARRERDPQGAEDVRRLAEAVRRAE
jgi:hypothetical protein